MQALDRSQLEDLPYEFFEYPQNVDVDAFGLSAAGRLVLRSHSAFAPTQKGGGSVLFPNHAVHTPRWDIAAVSYGLLRPGHQL